LNTGPKFWTIGTFPKERRVKRLGRNIHEIGKCRGG